MQHWWNSTIWIVHIVPVLRDAAKTLELGVEDGWAIREGVVRSGEGREGGGEEGRGRGRGKGTAHSTSSGALSRAKKTQFTRMIKITNNSKYLDTWLRNTINPKTHFYFHNAEGEPIKFEIDRSWERKGYWIDGWEETWFWTPNSIHVGSSVRYSQALG